MSQRARGHRGVCRRVGGVKPVGGQFLTAYVSTSNLQYLFRSPPARLTQCRSPFPNLLPPPPRLASSQSVHSRLALELPDLSGARFPWECTFPIPGASEKLPLQCRNPYQETWLHCDGPPLQSKPLNDDSLCPPRTNFPPWNSGFGKLKLRRQLF